MKLKRAVSPTRWRHVIVAAAVRLSSTLHVGAGDDGMMPPKTVSLLRADAIGFAASDALNTASIMKYSR